MNIEESEFDLNASVFSQRASKKAKMKRAECEVIRADANDDDYFQVFTHLGEFVTYNDSVLGYDLKKLNLAIFEEYKDKHGLKREFPDVVLVKKHYPKIRSKKRQRFWKLKHMIKEEEMDTEEVPAAKKKKQRGAHL